MRTLDRYIAGIFIRNLAVGIIGFTAMFFFQSMFPDLYSHSFSSNNVSVSQVIYYHWMGLPQIIVQMSAPAVLLATVMTFSGLARTHELVACFSIGTGVRRLLTVVMSIVFILACLIYIMEDRILPPMFRARTTYYWQVLKKQPDFFLDIKRDKIWYRSKNMIYNLKRFDPHSNTIHGMSIYTFDENFNLIEVVGAEKATHSSQGWKMMDGTVTIFEKDNLFPLTQDFKNKDMTINETPKEFQEIEKEVDGLRIKELHQYILRMKNAGADTKPYEVKLHSRLNLSFLPIVMCLLAVPFSISLRRQGGLAKDLGLCLGFTVFYWLLYSIGLSLGTKGSVPTWLGAWFPSVVFAGLAALLISRKQ